MYIIIIIIITLLPALCYFVCACVRFVYLTADDITAAFKSKHCKHIINVCSAVQEREEADLQMLCT